MRQIATVLLALSSAMLQLSALSLRPQLSSSPYPYSSSLTSSQRSHESNVPLTTLTTTATMETSRRSLFQSAISSVLATTSTIVLLTAIAPPQAALAIPMVSTAEFTNIVRDSARSIELVEFSGPQSETVVVRLVDGTTFGINDVIESPIDPRSPLKIAAVCNANNIPYAFVNLQALLATSNRKKKVYANARVLEAAEKNKEKAARMQQDEELRQAELAEMNAR